MSEPSIDVSDYDQSGYDYKKYWENRQYDDAVEREVLTNLLPSFGNNLVDLGGGYGRLMEVYQPRFKQVVICDFSKQLLQAAQSKIETKGYHNVTTQQGNVYELPFGNTFFDVVLMVRVLHHLERPSLALHEIQRVIKPGGLLVLQFANKVHLKNRIKAFMSRKPELIDKKPINLSETGIFYQFHPDYVKEKLTENDFSVIKIVSASHFRIPFVYRFIPVPFLMFLERIVEPLFTKFLLGPSLFVVAKKKE